MPRPGASLRRATRTGAPIIKYGMFINTVLDFVIVAFAVFLLIREVNRLTRKPAPPSPTTKECPYCIATVPLRATRCPSCTSELTPTPGLQPAE